MFKKVPLLVWFLVPTLIILGVGVWILSSGVGNLGSVDETKPVPVSKSVEGTQEFVIVSRQHIDTGKPGTGYNSNPPTSGPHWAQWVNKGIYAEEQQDEMLIHSLEHGYIWISYIPETQVSGATDGADLKTGIDEQTKEKLAAFVKKDDWKMVMAPRGANDAKIVLAAWGRLLKMDALDEQKVKDFIKTYRNRGPEQTME